MGLPVACAGVPAHARVDVDVAEGEGIPVGNVLMWRENAEQDPCPGHSDLIGLHGPIRGPPALIPYRSFNINDLVANGVGVVLGLMLYLVLRRRILKVIIP